MFLIRHKNELLNKARKFIKTGGNPAKKVDWYEDWAKEYNLTPEDLKEK